MWHYIYDITSGVLLSESSVEPTSGSSYYVRATRMDLATEQWNATTREIEAKNLTSLITPLVTKTQARDTLKVLLETAPGSWTATQEKQAQYLLLLFAFRDLKEGKVY